MKIAQVSIATREAIALGVVVAASIGGAVLAGNRAGEEAAQTASETVKREGAAYAYNIALSIWKGQIQACGRGNKLRRESNARIASHRADTEGLVRFLSSAIKVRRASGTPIDLQAVKEYQDIRHDVIAGAVFNPVREIKCYKVYPKPARPPGVTDEDLESPN